MEMVEGQKNTDTQASFVAEKKNYQSPALVEWGTILDLTRGLKAGFEDFPFFGGTKGV